MESTNVFRRLIAIFWVLGIVLRRHFFLATSVIVTALISSLEPVASLYIFSKVVDRSVDYVQGTATLREVGLVFALQGGLFAVQRIITPLRGWLGGILSNYLLNDITMDLMEKTSKLPYISLESEKIYNNLEMANGTKDRIPTNLYGDYYFRQQFSHVWVDVLATESTKPLVSGSHRCDYAPIYPFGSTYCQTELGADRKIINSPEKNGVFYQGSGQGE